MFGLFLAVSHMAWQNCNATSSKAGFKNPFLQSSLREWWPERSKVLWNQIPAILQSLRNSFPNSTVRGKVDFHKNCFFLSGNMLADETPPFLCPHQKVKTLFDRRMTFFLVENLGTYCIRLQQMCCHFECFCHENVGLFPLKKRKVLVAACTKQLHRLGLTLGRKRLNYTPWIEWFSLNCKGMV